MDLLNQTLNSFSAQISDLSVGLNPDIFETNVINITILLGGIIYLGSNALSASLSERQQKILGAIQEAEERLQHNVSFDALPDFRPNTPYHMSPQAGPVK